VIERLVYNNGPKGSRTFAAPPGPGTCSARKSAGPRNIVNTDVVAVFLARPSDTCNDSGEVGGGVMDAPATGEAIVPHADQRLHRDREEGSQAIAKTNRRSGVQVKDTDPLFSRDFSASPSGRVVALALDGLLSTG